MSRTVAIVVPDLDAACALYRDTLGARVSEPVDLPAHGVTTVLPRCQHGVTTTPTRPRHGPDTG